MGITPSVAPTLRRIYVEFLGGLPPTPSDPTDPECIKRALVRLAELAVDPSIASRSLKSPMSFSLVSSYHKQSNSLDVLMHETTNTGFLPFPSDYRSERKCVGRLPFIDLLIVRLVFSHAQQVLRTHKGALSSKERFRPARQRRLVPLAHRMPL